MSVDELCALVAGDPDDARGQTEHEPQLAREGQASARPPRPIVRDPVNALAAVGSGALLRGGQDHRLESQALLGGHDAATAVAVAAPDGQRMVEDVEHLHADSRLLPAMETGSVPRGGLEASGSPHRVRMRCLGPWRRTPSIWARRASPSDALPTPILRTLLVSIRPILES